MRFFMQKLFFTIVAVVCLSFAFLASPSAHAASVHHTSNHTRPFAVGGGCNTSSDGRVGSCISVNGSTVLADAYINGPCANAVYERIYDFYTNATTAWIYLGAGCGHFGIISTPDRGDAYFAQVYACFNDYCENQNSPLQYG